MNFYDEIYYTLIGQMEESAALSWVEDAFAPGSACDGAYERLMEARDRVLEKLGRDEDPDVSRMLAEMDTVQRLLCRKLLSVFIPQRADENGNPPLP